ncbi:UNVERIFIED_CONTAM: hypothetical protein Sradi_7095500, partial [Sesamum radiatum]
KLMTFKSIRSLFFVGNIPIKTTNSEFHDTIAEAFHQSSRKDLCYIPPTLQKGEIVVRPSTKVVETGSKRWNMTAVGYFLGNKPYFHHLEAFAKKNWTSLIRVTATVNGFFFFQFNSIAAMEEVIEGLSVVASGVGKPLYSDAVTKQCSRLDYARVCVMLDYNSTLPKHIVIISPVLRDGKEVPVRVDIDYEWLPKRCKECQSLGHNAESCPGKKKVVSTKPVEVYVQTTRSRLRWKEIRRWSMYNKRKWTVH